MFRYAQQPLPKPDGLGRTEFKSNVIAEYTGKRGRFAFDACGERQNATKFMIVPDNIRFVTEECGFNKEKKYEGEKTMKKTMKFLSFVIALMLCLSIVLVACDNEKVTLNMTEGTIVLGNSGKLIATSSKGSPITWSSDHPEIISVTEDGVVTALASGSATITASAGKGSASCTLTVGSMLTDIEDYRAYAIADLNKVKSIIGTVSATVDPQVTAAYNAGVTAINAATSALTVRTAYDSAKKAMSDLVPLANGVFDFTALSATQKTEILGILEEFAIRTGMTGTTLFENGGYIMYSDRVTLGAENYIVGYGFGVLAEGSITADLAAESNAAWKRYYHDYMSEDPGTINYLDEQGQDVGDLYSPMGGSYYTNFMNESKDGYEWVPELAAGELEPVNLNTATNQATKWRFEIRSGLKYSTLSTQADRAAYNDRAVEPEDFLTPFKLLLNQKNDLYRGGELSNQTGGQAIKGAKAYYEATKNAQKGIDDSISFDGVGLKVYEEEGKWYFEYELGAPVTRFYAKYYMSSGLYQPIPKSFIDLVGVDNYLGFSSDRSTTPIDNSLALGAYVLEAWNPEQQIVFKKNPNYVYADTKYSIEGIHYNILKADLQDKEAGIKEFLAGKIDASGIPDTYLDQYKSDHRTKTTTGTNTTKLNMNATNAETWERLFGIDGEVRQTPANQYWAVEPAMNNGHFREALSYALNRKAFADAKGVTATANYFSPNYMSDPENGISYNSTDAHKNAVSSLVNENTDAYGYSLQLARDYFRLALDELEASGAYIRGTKANPTVINIEIAWMAPSQRENMHQYVAQYWETAFNDESVHGGCYKLVVEFQCGDQVMDVYDKKIDVGQFDVAYGGITGNPLDPLGFMNVLSTDQSISNRFTLNWAVDTSDPTADLLVYYGMRWSFDALYQSSQQANIVKDGANVPATEMTAAKGEKKGENVEVTVSVTVQDGVTIKSAKFVVFGGGATAEEDYIEVDVSSLAGEPTIENNVYTYTLTITPDKWATIVASENQGLDVFVTYEINTGTSTATSADVFQGSYYYKFK